MASVCQGHCGSCRRGHEAQRSDGSFGRQASAISISTLTGSFDALNDLETFTIEQHVLSKLTETGEISLVCLSPYTRLRLRRPHRERMLHQHR